MQGTVEALTAEGMLCLSAAGGDSAGNASLPRGRLAGKALLVFYYGLPSCCLRVPDVMLG